MSRTVFVAPNSSEQQSGPDLIKDLAKRHRTFQSSNVCERVRLAELLLTALRSDEWSQSGGWIHDEIALLKLPLATDPETKQIASITRFLIGSMVKTFLSTFIQSATSSGKEAFTSKPTRNVEHFTVHGPYAIGVSAPGVNFDLFADSTNFKPSDDAILAFDESCRAGTVSVVLGAGNQDFLLLIDVLDRVLIHSECVLLKHHPLRQFLFEPFKCLLGPLIEDGVVGMVLDEGNVATDKLLKDPLVGHVHLTGSTATYRKVLAAVNPDCGVTGELGCATPYIVVPGQWTEKELRNGAKLVATSKKMNGGSNCLCAQVLVLPSAWPQKQEFLNAVEAELESQRTAPVYYPGSLQQKETMVAHYKDRARCIQSKNRMSSASQADDTVIVDCGIVSAGTGAKDGSFGEHARANGMIFAEDTSFDNYALMNEAFGPVLALVEIASDRDEDTGAYMKKACDFVNMDVAGSLSCTLLAPKSANNDTVETCVAALDYGSIMVNTLNHLGYQAALLGGTWGAHASDTTRNVKGFTSGRGRIGNIYNVPHVVKTVVRGPLNSLEKPPMDNSQMPPQILFDILYTTIVASTGAMDGCCRAMKMVFTRAAQAMFSSRESRRYGAML